MTERRAVESCFRIVQQKRAHVTTPAVSAAVTTPATMMPLATCPAP